MKVRRANKLNSLLAQNYAVKLLATIHLITVIWLSWYSRMLGNIWLEFLVQIVYSETKSTKNSRTEKQLLKHWQATKGMEINKFLIKGPYKENTKLILSLLRNKCRIFVGLLIGLGHSFCNYKIGLGNNILCWKCRTNNPHIKSQWTIIKWERQNSKKCLESGKLRNADFRKIL